MKLSKRELVMLIFLVIIAVVFIEYRFIIVPGIARFDALSAKKLQVEDQVNTIQLNLTIAKQNERKRDENLDAISNLAERYFGELHMDAILVRAHDLVLEQGFKLTQYQINPILATTLEPHVYGSFDISYELKTLAKAYQALVEQHAPQAEISLPADELISADQVEQVQILINATGTYDQVKAFLDAITNLRRSVVVASLSLIPDLSIEPEIPAEPTVPGEPEPATPIVEPTTPEEQILTISMTMYYYGIVKLIPEEDEYNEWYREPFIPVTYTPFKQPPSPTPSETSATTAATELVP